MSADRIETLERYAAGPLGLNQREKDELRRLIRLERRRYQALPGRIARAQAVVESIIALLSPADQLRQRRADMRRATNKFNALEEALQPGARADRIEAELRGLPTSTSKGISNG